MALIVAEPAHQPRSTVETGQRRPEVLKIVQSRIQKDQKDATILGGSLTLHNDDKCVRADPLEACRFTPVTTVIMTLSTTPSSSSTPSITSLALQAATLSGAITSYLHDGGYTQPDFSPSSPALPETSEYDALRDKFNDAARDLIRLINSPENFPQT